MTIQRLSTVQNSGSHFSTANLSEISPENLPLSSLDHKQVKANPAAIVDKLELKSDSSPVTRTNQIFQSHSESLKSFKLEEKKRRVTSFIDRLLNETTKAIKDNFKRLVEEGDQSFNQNRLNDAEKQYAEALKMISGKDDIYEAKCSKKLGALYLERAKQEGSLEDRKEDCMNAAGILNYGLLLAFGQNKYELQEEIYEKLNRVDDVLCSLCGVRTNSNKGAYWDTQNKQALEEMRKNIQNKLFGFSGDPEPVRQLFKEITSDMKAFAAKLIEQSIKILGTPPLNCEFAIIGLGSMARDEMTPFSDFEFAILIEEGKETDQVKEYFRNLTHLMHLRILNLGETIVPALGIKALEGFYDKVTLRGFAFDGKGCFEKGHKTPLGKKGVFELIQTPTKMASFQGKNGDQYWYKQEPFLPTELHNVAIIYGKEGLVKSYMKELDTALIAKSEEDSTLRMHYAKKHLFKEDLIAFEANFGFTSQGMLFELKNDLYRMPHLFVERLFLSECEKLVEAESVCGTFSKIDWLAQGNKLALSGAKNLKGMFAKVLLSRLKNSYKTNSSKSYEDPLISSSQKIDEKICNIYCQFCKAVKENFEAQMPLHGKSFFTADPYVLAQIKVRLGRPQEGRECILEHLKTVPDHVDGLILAVHIFKGSDDIVFVRSSLDKATKKIKDLGSDQIDTKAIYLSKVGVLYSEIGESFEAIKIFEEAWDLIKDIPSFVRQYPNISNNLSIVYLRNGYPIKAKKVLEKALQALKDKSIPMNAKQRLRGLSCCLNNLSEAYRKLNNSLKSRKYAEKYLKTIKQIYGSKHRRVAEVMSLLANIYFENGLPQEGIQYFQQALKIIIEDVGPLHKDSILASLSLLIQLNKIDPENHTISNDYLEQAEKIENIDSSFCHFVAIGWQRINQFERAKKILLKAVAIAEKQQSLDDLSQSYNLLTKLCSDNNRKFDALQYAEKSLEYSRAASRNRPDKFVVATLVNLAELKTFQLIEHPPQDMPKYKKLIIEHLTEAERMSIEISKTANTSNLFASIYYRFGVYEFKVTNDLEKAADYFIKSLTPIEEGCQPETDQLLNVLKILKNIYSKVPEKKKELFNYFKNLLNLLEKHFGKSSQEYSDASSVLKPLMEE